jgi:hypothetical protein
MLDHDVLAVVHLGPVVVDYTSVALRRCFLFNKSQPLRGERDLGIAAPGNRATGIEFVYPGERRQLFLSC